MIAAYINTRGIEADSERMLRVNSLPEFIRMKFAIEI